MSGKSADRETWRAAERLLRIYGKMAVQECRDRISYCHMTWKWADARVWRQRLDIVRRLRGGEQPPLFLDEAVAAGRFQDFLAEQEARGVQIASLEQDVTAVIRALIQSRLREIGAIRPA